jgi:DNA-binding LacI/PurR family transcriptional regulator
VDDGGGQVDADRPAEAADAVMARRLSGVFAALETVGVPGSAVPVVECSANDEQAGAVGAALLLDDPARPTAVLALSDQLALGVLRCARDRGIRVPSALSVVGFDDAPPGRTSSPPLTTVAQPLRERGLVVGALMAELLRGGTVTSPPPFATRLVVRGSTARAGRH